jgi:predicted ATP-grasp superfamily ATP-dependent carboligase
MAVEYLPGEEWDCDVSLHERESDQHYDQKEYPHDGKGLTAVLEVAPNPELEGYCSQIVSLLGLSYIVCISFKGSLDGTFKLLEINPRVMGNILVSALAGNNYVRMAVDLLNGENVTPAPIEYGIRTALYYDQMRILNTRTSEETGDRK